jgi:hypothetical protein
MNAKRPFYTLLLDVLKFCAFVLHVPLFWAWATNVAAILFLTAQADVGWLDEVAKG